MSEKQLQQLPSVSKVLLEVRQSITLHNNYIKEEIYDPNGFSFPWPDY